MTANKPSKSKTRRRFGTDGFLDNPVPMPARGKQRKFHDRNSPLGLRVSVNKKGEVTKTFFIHPLVPNGEGGKKRTYHSLGTYPRLSYESAVQEALALKPSLESGAKVQPSQHTVVTLQSAFTSWIASRHRAAATVSDYTNMFNNHTTEVERASPVSRFDWSWLELKFVTLTAAGKQRQADKFLDVLKAVLKRGGLSYDPGIHSLPAKNNPPRKPGSIRDPKDFGMIYNAAAKWPNPVTGRFIRLLALSGMRPIELRSLRWEYVNWRRSELTLPVTKNKLPLTLPLAPAQIELFQQQECWIQNQSWHDDVRPQFVFPTTKSVYREDSDGAKATPYLSMNVAKRFWNSVSQDLGYNVSSYDLRNFFCDFPEREQDDEGLDIEHRIVVALTNHQPDDQHVGVHRGYQDSRFRIPSMKKRREAQERIVGWMLDLEASYLKDSVQ